MPEIALFLLDRSTADSLASDAAAFAEQHEIELAPHECPAVMIAGATAQMLADGGATVVDPDDGPVWRWQLRVRSL